MLFSSVIVDAADNPEVSSIVVQFLKRVFEDSSEVNSQTLAAALDELQVLSSSYIVQNSNISYRLISLVSELIRRAESNTNRISREYFWNFLEQLSVSEQAKWILFETAVVLKDQMASPSSEIKELKSLSKRIKMQLSLLEDAKTAAFTGVQVSDDEILDLEKALKKTIERSKRLLGNYL